MYPTPYRLALVVLLSATCAGAQEPKPRIEHCFLDIHLTPPGGFRAEAVLKLENISRVWTHIYLNKSLQVTAAEDGNKNKVAFQDGYTLFRRYHREGRPVVFRFGEVPRDGRLTLRVRYQGKAQSGPEGSDWRGILFVGEDHARMCEQTIFYPLVPLSPTSPATQRVKATVVVHAPADFEVFAPGELVEKAKENDDTTRWRFECKTPSLLSVMAGRYHRVEKTVGGTKIVTLMFPRPKDRDLSQAFVESAAKVLRYYQETYGGVPSKALGIVEIRCRKGHSYNWAAQDLAVFDRGALGNGVPLASLAHEIAHLWWGQAVRAGGDGERFLTESFAEYSSWRYLDHANQEQELHKSVRHARSSYLAAAARGEDTALGKVSFRTKGYNTLVYAKGPLVLRWVEATVGKDVMDRAMRDYATRCRTTIGTVPEFLASLRKAASQPDLQIPSLEHDGHLRLALHSLEYSKEEGVLTGSIRATVLPEGATFPIAGNVPVRARSAKASVDAWIKLSGAESKFSLKIDQKPDTITLDPDRTWPISPGDPVVWGGARLVGSEVLPRSIALDFDRPLRALSKDELRRFVPAALSARLENDGRRLVLEDTPRVPGWKYTLNLRDHLRDTDGIPVLTERFAFEVPASDDREPPKIVSSVPADGAKDVDPNLREIRVTFSETMRRITGFSSSTIREYQSRGILYPQFTSLDWGPDNKVLIGKIKGLKPGRTYVLPFIGRRTMDLNGNRLVDRALMFTTSGK